MLPLVRPLREDFLNRPQQQHCHDSDPYLRVSTYNIIADQNSSRYVDMNDDTDRLSRCAFAAGSRYQCFHQLDQAKKGVDANSGVREGCAIFWSLGVFESVRAVDMRKHTFRGMIQQFSCEERMHKGPMEEFERYGRSSRQA